MQTDWGLQGVLQYSAIAEVSTTHTCLCSYKWDTLPSDKRPERGLLAIRAGLNAFANLRPAIVPKQVGQQGCSNAWPACASVHGTCAWGVAWCRLEGQHRAFSNRAGWDASCAYLPTHLPALLPAAGRLLPPEA